MLQFGLSCYYNYDKGGSALNVNEVGIIYNVPTWMNITDTSLYAFATLHTIATKSWVEFRERSTQGVYLSSHNM